MHSDFLLVKVEGEERAEGEWLSQERSHKTLSTWEERAR